MSEQSGHVVLSQGTRRIGHISLINPTAQDDWYYLEVNQGLRRDQNKHTTRIDDLDSAQLSYINPHPHFIVIRPIFHVFRKILDHFLNILSFKFQQSKLVFICNFSISVLYSSSYYQYKFSFFSLLFCFKFKLLIVIN